LKKVQNKAPECTTIRCPKPRGVRSDTARKLARHASLKKGSKRGLKKRKGGTCFLKRTKSPRNQKQKRVG